jgi:hypothetical protein
MQVNKIPGGEGGKPSHNPVEKEDANDYVYESFMS